MLQLEDVVREVTAKSPQERKRMQLQAIRDLHERGLEDSDIAAYMDSDTRDVTKWVKGKVTARPPIVAGLVHLSRMKRLPRIERREGLRAGRVAKSELPRVQNIMREHGLWPPRERVRTLTALLKATNLTKRALARKLNVGKTQLHKYFDPDYQGVMSEPMIEVIVNLKRELERPKAALTPAEELKQYARVLFGRQYAEEGFPPDSLLKERAFKELHFRTGMGIRALENNFPPKANRQPRRGILHAMKLAAAKGPLLPELAGRKGGGARKKAAAGAAR